MEIPPRLPRKNFVRIEPEQHDSGRDLAIWRAAGDQIEEHARIIAPLIIAIRQPNPNLILRDQIGTIDFAESGLRERSAQFRQCLSHTLAEFEEARPLPGHFECDHKC
jgi:hypothetical protein